MQVTAFSKLSFASCKRHCEQLQALYDKYKSQKFTVIGFPCNQFGRQVRINGIVALMGSIVRTKVACMSSVGMC
jgi:hypothetical protein